MFWNQYPYINLNDLNLDFLLKSIGEMKYEVENFVSLNAIKYANPIQWNITRQYEKNTVVIDPLTGTAYISVKAVPSGVELNRSEFWTEIFDLSSFIERAVQNFSNRWESEPTTTATFSTPVNGWLVWNDVLYKALVAITAGDTYVVNSNISHITIEDIYNELLTALSQEITARTNADTAINTALSQEVTARTNADTAINTALSQEVTARTNADTAINTALSQEVTARTNADAAINTKIGNLANLTTSDKTSIVNAINELDEEAKNAILVIGNSYVQRHCADKLKSHFSRSYEKVHGGSGFVNRSDNPTTYEDLLDAAISDPNVYNNVITDIIFVSAMGDTWAITAQGESTYEAALETTFASIISKISANFPKCKRIAVTLAESRNATYFSDDRYDAPFRVHRLFKKLCPRYSMDYIGWTGWNAILAGSDYFEIDNYHPTAAGASLIGQDIVNAYFGNLEYSTKFTSGNCALHLTSAGTINVTVQITPEHETITIRVGNITAGAQTIAVGDLLIDFAILPLPPLAPLDQTNIYLQSDVCTLAGTNNLTRVACTLENNTNGVGTLKLANVTDGNNIGSSQVIFKEWCNIDFTI